MTEELTTIRERLVRVETSLCHLSRTIEAAIARLEKPEPREKNGSIVVPVAVAVGLMELITQLLGKLVS